MVDPRVRKYLRLLEPIPSGYPSGGCLVGPIQAVLFDIYGTLFISACGDISVQEANFSTASSLEALLGEFRIGVSPTDLTRSLHQKIQDEHQRKRMAGIEWPEVDIVSVWQTILDWPDTDRVIKRYRLKMIPPIIL